MWQATDGIDLIAPDATVVRAFAESYFIATWDPADGFPGFVDFLGHNGKPILDSYRSYRFGGTRRMLLQSIHRDGDRLEASICNDQAGIYVLGQPRPAPTSTPPHPDPDLYGPGGRPYVLNDLFVITVSLSSTGTPTGIPKVVDRGTARAPNWNPFSGWQFQKHDLLFFDEQNHYRYTREQQQSVIDCNTWALHNNPGIVDPGPPPRRMYPDGTPPTLTQYPGWTRVGEP
ncbi:MULTISPECIES: hypothetical protein [unclassified Gordonia (in: high G+C Gram-positive bacteria)]